MQIYFLVLLKGALNKSNALTICMYVHRCTQIYLSNVMLASSFSFFCYYFSDISFPIFQQENHGKHFKILFHFLFTSFFLLFLSFHFSSLAAFKHLFGFLHKEQEWNKKLKDKQASLSFSFCVPLKSLCSQIKWGQHLCQVFYISLLMLFVWR